MAGNKIFAGVRLRRMRNRLELSQIALAQSLGISASYLNLMERDQRPLTAQVILKLSALHGADISELSAIDQTSDVLAALKEMAADPLLAEEIPLVSELTDAIQAVPNLVGATLKLYRAYCEMLKRLAELSQEITVSGSLPASVVETPFERVRRWLADEPPLFPTLERLAEEVWYELSPKDDPMAGLKARLRGNSGIDVRVLPLDVMPADSARYDRHSQRLFLSERLSSQDRLMETARLVARLEGGTAIDEIVSRASFADSPECQRMARQAMVRQLAVAILCPAARYLSAALDLRFDVAALAARFQVRAGVAMQRLAALSARGDAELPIGFLSVDATGAIIDRCGRLGFFLPKTGALCGRLPVFDGGQGTVVAQLSAPGDRTLLMVAMPDGQPGVTSALCLAAEDAAGTVYAQLATAFPSRPVGPSCRLCEVRNCTLRREPQATRPAALNEFVRGASDFEPVS